MGEPPTHTLPSVTSSELALGTRAVGSVLFARTKSDGIRESVEPSASALPSRANRNSSPPLAEVALEAPPAALQAPAPPSGSHLSLGALAESILRGNASAAPASDPVKLVEGTGDMDDYALDPGELLRGSEPQVHKTGPQLAALAVQQIRSVQR